MGEVLYDGFEKYPVTNGPVATFQTILALRAFASHGIQRRYHSIAWANQFDSWELTPMSLASGLRSNEFGRLTG